MIDEKSTNEDNEERIIAEAFGRNHDPLEEYQETFRRLEREQGIDPIEDFWEKSVRTSDLAPRTLEAWERTFRQWRESMERQSRHPACPSKQSVLNFVEHLIKERGNGRDTIENKLYRVNRAFEYWQNVSRYPHSEDYNPIAVATKEVTLPGEETKPPHPITLDELRDIVGEATNLRDRLIIVMQLKMAIRASTLCNVQLRDINLQSPDVKDHYEELGTHPEVADRPNTIYVNYEREGSKSMRPRILPIDDELRRVLLQYLLVRPDRGDPHLILSHSTHSMMGREGINNAWQAYLPEAYRTETEKYRSVGSHYGRHKFTTYFKTQVNNGQVPREMVQYMRGDRVSSGPNFGQDGIDHYLHVYYRDIKETYLENIYKFGI